MVTNTSYLGNESPRECNTDHLSMFVEEEKRREQVGGDHKYSLSFSAASSSLFSSVGDIRSQGFKFSVSELWTCMSSFQPDDTHSHTGLTCLQPSLRLRPPDLSQSKSAFSVHLGAHVLASLTPCLALN